MHSDVELKGQKYHIGIDRNFTPKLRSCDPRELQSLQLPVPPINLLDAIDRGDLTLSTDGVHMLQQLVVTAKHRLGKHYWENYEGEINSSDIIFYPDRDAEKYYDQGVHLPTLIEYLKSKLPELKGSDNISGYTGYRNENLNYFDNGPTYGRRPIIWYVNNRFSCATGVVKYIKKPENIEDIDDIGSGAMVPQEFPFYMDEASKVLISLKKPTVDDWRSFKVGGTPINVHIYQNYNSSFNFKLKGLRTTWFKALVNPQTYEETELVGIIPDQDFRRTLLWEPNLTIDANGKVSFKVMVNSTCCEMYYSAEGITADGSVVVSK